MKRRLRILNGLCKSIAVIAFILGLGVFSAWEQGTLTFLHMLVNATLFFGVATVFYRLKPSKLLRRYYAQPSHKKQHAVVHMHPAA